MEEHIQTISPLQLFEIPPLPLFIPKEKEDLIYSGQ